MVPNVILITIPQCIILNIQNKLVEEWSRNSDFSPTKSTIGRIINQECICLFIFKFSDKKLAMKGNKKSNEASLPKTNPPFLK